MLLAYLFHTASGIAHESGECDVGLALPSSTESTAADTASTPSQSTDVQAPPSFIRNAIGLFKNADDVCCCKYDKCKDGAQERALDKAKEHDSSPDADHPDFMCCKWKPKCYDYVSYRHEFVDAMCPSDRELCEGGGMKWCEATQICVDHSVQCAPAVMDTEVPEKGYYMAVVVDQLDGSKKTLKYEPSQNKRPQADPTLLERQEYEDDLWAVNWVPCGDVCPWEYLVPKKDCMKGRDVGTAHVQHFVIANGLRDAIFCRGEQKVKPVERVRYQPTLVEAGAKGVHTGPPDATHTKEYLYKMERVHNQM